MAFHQLKFWCPPMLELEEPTGPKDDEAAAMHRGRRHRLKHPILTPYSLEVKFDHQGLAT
eukprot:CAMPEP_0180382386 /NCGR_PEP_ID=MMETSP0989-20121125/27314_1 /TAXON_ID=697907 /ORGANISM="non described non described, Strain CCMP2293" /LENGTH=59 /DNA_ID=CAMNT_0022382451 /DNA_START=495 /DNA_END=675 /DNA_ORIENTATION=-